MSQSEHVPAQQAAHAVASRCRRGACRAVVIAIMVSAMLSFVLGAAPWHIAAPVVASGFPVLRLLEQRQHPAVRPDEEDEEDES